MLKARIMLGVGMALASGTASAAEFDWLAGQWCGGSTERKIEEVWLPEAGGALLGMSRTVRGSSTESFEFMRLVPAGKNTGLYVQPNGVAPTVFAIANHGDGWVVFENPRTTSPTASSTAVMVQDCAPPSPGRVPTGRRWRFRLTTTAVVNEQRLPVGAMSIGGCQPLAGTNQPAGIEQIAARPTTGRYRTT